MNLPNGIMNLINKDMKNIRGEVLRSGETLEWFAGNGKMILIHRYAKDQGWEIFFPADDTNKVNASEEAVKKYLES